jgi:predicted secreted protein
VPSEASSDVVTLRVGEQHPVRLAGLGTAGYHWMASLEGDEGVADVATAGLAEPANTRIGTSADELFTIRALRQGTARVRFAQRRPWESADTPPVNEHIVELRVRSRRGAG